MRKVKCERCPVPGPCLGQRPETTWACAFAAPEADPNKRRWLTVASAHAGGSPPPDAAEPPEYPPLAAQVGNLVGAAVRFAASGLATVDQAEYDRRRSICQACPTGQYDAEQDRCFRCACYLAVKPWGKAERCPDGHW